MPYTTSHNAPSLLFPGDVISGKQFYELISAGILRLARERLTYLADLEMQLFPDDTNSGRKALQILNGGQSVERVIYHGGHVDMEVVFESGPGGQEMEPLYIESGDLLENVQLKTVRRYDGTEDPLLCIVP